MNRKYFFLILIAVVVMASFTSCAASKRARMRKFKMERHDEFMRRAQNAWDKM